MEAKAKTVGMRIKLMRVSKQLPQNEVARRVGISQAHLSNIESGHSTITLDKLFKLRDVLGCKLKDFFVDLDGEESSQENLFSLEELSTALLSMRSRQASLSEKQ